ncbi:MAG: efflux RND transporter permease subunit [Desulfobulbaceae bacterium]|nr:efflux RND transporter permease subunit [Desulfobulbaceae bacterium]HIJ78391.1 efflux RND transporter permease subunit [Deltaproteobacteria bacterium]
MKLKGPVSWMAHNHVAANLLMFMFIIGGLVLGYSLKQEVFPEILLDKVSVEVRYPGASPEEVEEGIILKIEEAISGIDGIKEVSARAVEGSGTVTALLHLGEDADRVVQDIKSEVDRITTFPEEAEKPVTAKLTNRMEVVSLVVYGNCPERSLREWAEIIRDELLAHDEITQADLAGVRPYEISIDIDENNLRRYNLTLEQVAQLVRQASLDLPGGAIKAQGGEILVRTKERRYDKAAYDNIIVKVNGDGSILRLHELAEVRDTFEETDLSSTFDGQPAALVKVFRVGSQKPLVISRLVNEYVKKKQAALPDSIKIASWNDTTELFKSRMNLLIKNAALGLILVFIILSLFLQIRLALWVMLGIPISFFGAVLLMPFFGVSINMITLFAFIMALGIVVDDAIVVGENIFEHRQMGKSYMQAAVDGAREVARPVTFSVLTTITAFTPLIFVEGVLGKFIKVIPLVVIAIIAVSLIESLFVLPAHLSFGGKRPPAATGFIAWLDRVRARVAAGLARFIQGPYRWQLNWCLKNRYASLALALVFLMLSVGLVKGGLVKFNFMPVVDADFITANLEMPTGTLVGRTAEIAEMIVKAGQEVVAEYDSQRPAGDTVLRHIYAMVGGRLDASGPMEGGGVSGANLSSIAMILKPSEIRKVKSSEIEARWREKVGEIPGVQALTFSANLVHMGANIDVQLAHDDEEMVIGAMQRLKKALTEYPGVSDIADNFPQGKREYKLQLTPAARTLGITEEGLARQVRSAFYGAEALRLQRGRNEVKVMVRYPEAQRQNVWDFNNMRIRTPGGGEVPLLIAAQVAEGRSYSAINRNNRKRVINITAKVDSNKANSEEILSELKESVLRELVHDYPGLTYSMEGEAKERRDSMGSMLRGFVLALFVIYGLLAIPFRSYSQPLLIMTAIPFGMVGAVLGHLVMGFSLSMLSLFGIVALSGVVVNDSLLLIDYVNGHRRDGKPMVEAVKIAGERRFRPILLTSLTTFFGLMPMIFETSVQAQFLIPMAISLGFGIMFATGITLLLIPTLYVVLDDIHCLLEGGKKEEAAGGETGIIG